MPIATAAGPGSPNAAASGHATRTIPAVDRTVIRAIGAMPARRELMSRWRPMVNISRTVESEPMAPMLSALRTIPSAWGPIRAPAIR
jgi:hypothetical protein